MFVCINECKPSFDGCINIYWLTVNGTLVSNGHPIASVGGNTYG